MCVVAVQCAELPTASQMSVLSDSNRTTVRPSEAENGFHNCIRERGSVMSRPGGAQSQPPEERLAEADAVCLPNGKKAAKGRRRWGWWGAVGK